jgi:hypothetical protein
VKIKLDMYSGTEDQTMSGASEVECAYGITFLYVRAFLYGDFAARDFSHSDSNEAHEADLWIIGLNENQRSGG